MKSSNNKNKISTKNKNPQPISNTKYYVYLGVALIMYLCIGFFYQKWYNSPKHVNLRRLKAIEEQEREAVALQNIIFIIDSINNLNKQMLQNKLEERAKEIELLKPEINIVISNTFVHNEQVWTNFTTNLFYLKEGTNILSFECYDPYGNSECKTIPIVDPEPNNRRSYYEKNRHFDATNNILYK